MKERITVSGTEFQRGYGTYLDAARSGAHVTITAHGRPQAVVISVAEHAELEAAQAAMARAGLSPSWASLDFARGERT